MTELWNAYWPMILVGIAIGIIVGLIIFRRPKQRVTLSQEAAPLRPHMAVTRDEPVPGTVPAPRPGEGEGVATEIAAAASDVVGQVIEAPVHDHLPGGHDTPDNLQRMKGVGPKLAGLLQARGLVRFEQIAALGPEEVAAIDADLGAFKGRLTRDRVIEQARYLARGDEAGYEREFGKL